MSDVILYAKQNNHPLFVTVRNKKENKEFKLTVARYKQMIKNYCTWYETRISFHSYSDYEDTIKLANGIEFNAILY